MYHGATPKREYPVTMVRVAGVEENGDEIHGEETRQARSGIVLELTVKCTRCSREKRVEWRGPILKLSTRKISIVTRKDTHAQ